MTKTAPDGVYIYGITAAGRAKSFAAPGIGERGDKLYAICSAGLAAVVSDSPVVKYSVSRENMLAHERAVEEVMKEQTVLPARFCTIAADGETVKKILAKEQARFADLLKKMEGKRELGLKAVFREEFIYKDILAKHDAIRQLKEALISQPPAKTHQQRMAVGEMVEQALVSAREKYQEAILDILRPLAEDVKINNDYGERMLLNAAFLVKKDKEAAFDHQVNVLGEKYTGKIKFIYVGPLPPFNFVNLVIETAGYN